MLLLNRVLFDVLIFILIFITISGSGSDSDSDSYLDLDLDLIRSQMLSPNQHKTRRDEREIVDQINEHEKRKKEKEKKISL